MKNTNTKNAVAKLKFMRLLRIEEFDKNPKLCKFCNKPLQYDKRYNDFCSHSCAASFCNIGHPHHGKTLPHCIICNKQLFDHGMKYCRKCKFIISIKNKMINGNKIEDKQIKKYLLLTRDYVCNRCHRTEWEGQPISIETHHKDGNNENNKEENLELLCKNCHALTDTYGIKNLGNGRKSRKH